MLTSQQYETLCLLAKRILLKHNPNKIDVDVGTWFMPDTSNRDTCLICNQKFILDSDMGDLITDLTDHGINHLKEYKLLAFI